MTTRKLLFTLFLTGCFFKSFAQPGTLDASFNSTGIKTFSFKQNISSEHVAGSAADASGNLYVTGSETTAAGTLPFVIKVLPSGKLDPTFGTNGKITLDFLNPQSFVPAAIVMHTDGGIVLAGYCTRASANSIPCIVKLLSNGTLDFNFNYSGSGFTTFPSYGQDTGSGFTAVHMSSQATDADIIASGSSAGAGSSYADFIVVRINGVNGTPLDGWGDGNGQNAFDIGGAGDYCNASALVDDTLYMGGGNTILNTMGIAAIDLSTGSITSYGYEILPLIGGTTLNYCTAIQAASDGSVVLGGYATEGGNNNYMIYKLTPTGSFDYSQTYPIGSSTDSKVYSLLLEESTNSILIGGSIVNTVSSNYNWALIRAVYTTGVQNTTFGIQSYTTINSSAFEGIGNIHKLNSNYILTGTVHNPVTGATDIKTKTVDINGAAVGSEGTFWIMDGHSLITDMTKRSDGKLWVCGTYKDDASDRIPVLTLLNSDGSIDKSFGGTGGADSGMVELRNIAPTIIRVGMRVGALSLQGDDLVIAGNYLDTSIFVIRVKSNGTLDNNFNGSFHYNDLAGPNSNQAYVHQVLIQPDNKILVHGYLGGSQTIARFNSDGTTDTGFGSGTGRYALDSTDVNEYDVLGVQLALQSNNKIVAVGTLVDPSNISNNLLAFRLNTDGTRDYTFATAKQGLFTYNPTGANGVWMATSVVINSKDKIIVGGLTQVAGGKPLRTEASPNTLNYVLLQVNTDGTLDNSFALNGVNSFNKGYKTQGIEGLQLENDNAIVATGVATDFGDVEHVTVMRFDGSGSLDNSFNGQGHYDISKGEAKKALILGGSLYIIGGDDAADKSLNGYIAKLKLGTGPVIKTTYLALPNYINKFYGDKPFNVKGVTNSPAPVIYSVSGSTCATIDSISGLVKLTCANINPGVTITATQAVVAGYTAATTSTTLYIARGIPTIVFDEQGGIVGEKFKLAFQTNYNDPALTYYTQLDPYYSPAFNLYNNDSIEVLGEGTAKVSIYFSGTANYESANAIAVIHGYISPLAPIASDDAVTLTAGIDNGAVIQVLANDQAFSGQIVARSVDLNPATPDVIDTVYVSPALGLFYTDTLGAVYYTPFVGLIGSGSISYTIRDNHGLVSESAKISISVKVFGEKAALKADELFTPNNDGFNDAFVINTDLDKTNILKIYDRNGGELFTLSNYKNNWTGDMPNGNKAESGIYYYFFQEGDAGDQRELKGVVELRR